MKHIVITSCESCPYCQVTGIIVSNVKGSTHVTKNQYGCYYYNTDQVREPCNFKKIEEPLSIASFCQLDDV